MALPAVTRWRLSPALCAAEHEKPGLRETDSYGLDMDTPVRAGHPMIAFSEQRVRRVLESRVKRVQPDKLCSRERCDHPDSVKPVTVGIPIPRARWEGRARGGRRRV